MRTSLVYRHPLLYEATMALLYGRHYRARQSVIAEMIPNGVAVVDVCCGPGRLYTHFLRHRHVEYTGIDINDAFLTRLRQRGAATILADVSSLERLPEADVVVMQASLYHFLPDVEKVLDRMLDAARLKVILSEPIRNLTDSGNLILRWLARRGTNPGTGSAARRFTPDTLSHVLAPYEDRILERGEIPGGREMYVVFRGCVG